MSDNKKKTADTREQEVFQAKKFINALFGPMSEGEYVAISMPLGSKRPGFPVTEEYFSKKFPRSGGQEGNRAYVSTAVLHPIEQDGKLILFCVGMG